MSRHVMGTNAGEELPGAGIEGGGDSPVVEALKNVLVQSNHDAGQWRSLAEEGASDAELRSAITFLVGPRGRSDSRGLISQIRTKPQLAFWLGSYGVGEPALSGDELVAKVREAMNVPPPVYESAPYKELAGCGWAFSLGGEGYVGVNEGMGLTTEPAESLRQALEFAGGLEPAEEGGREAAVLGGMAGEHSADAVGGRVGAEDGGRQSLARQSSFVDQPALFDYSQLDETVAAVVRQHADDIRGLAKRVVADVIAIGAKLAEVRSHLRHGAWGPWLKGEFGWSHDTALRFMNVAARYGADPNVARYALVALYDLSARSTPDEARREAAELAASGEEVSAAAAKEIIGKYAAPKGGGVSEAQGTLPHTVMAAAGPEGAGSDGAEPEALQGEGAEAEVVATGRTSYDLLSLLKATPGGVAAADLIRMGFAENQIEAARRDRLIETNRADNYCYSWKAEDVARAIEEKGPLTFFALEQMGCTRYAISDAEEAGLIGRNAKDAFVLAGAAFPAPAGKGPHAAATQAKPAGASGQAKADAPALEQLLKGRPLVVTFSYLSFFPGKVSVGVRVGDDPTRLATCMVDVSRVRNFAEPVQELIAAQIKAADDRAAGEKSAPAKPPAKSARPPKATAAGGSRAAGKAAAGKAAPARAASAPKRSSRPGAGKKTTAKAGASARPKS